jgi:hypothetical protein
MNLLTHDNNNIDTRPLVQELFKNLKTALPALEKMLHKMNGEWYGEDGIYRFYHQSFKTYRLQSCTEQIVIALSNLMPHRSFNEWFETIILEGTGKHFDMNHSNRNWLKETRPIIEAYSHAKYFLEMAVKYGKLLDTPPNMLPTGWAAFLYLYNLR